MSERDIPSIEPFELKTARGTTRRESVLPRADMPIVECAFCGSRNTEPTSIYGCHMMLAQYYCRSCRTTFDWVREEWKSRRG